MNAMLVSVRLGNDIERNTKESSNFNRTPSVLTRFVQPEY